MKPERVRQAAEEADRKIMELANKAANPDATDSANDDPPKSDPEPAPEAKADEPNPTPADPSPAEPVSDDKVAELQSELEKANQRWRTLDGMIRAQNQEMQRYKERVEELETSPPAPEQPAQPAGPQWGQNEEDTFGADLVAYIHKVATDIAQQTVGSMKEDLSGLKTTVDKTSEMSTLSARESFETKLDRAAPKWRELDTDQQFIDWLQSRPTLHQSFHAAVQSLDYAGVADAFNLYTELTEKANAPDPETQKRRKDLENQAAPSKARQPSASAADDEPDNQWTLSEIQQVYRTKRGRDGRQLTSEEFDRLEREIADAQAQGRVDFNR